MATSKIDVFEFLAQKSSIAGGVTALSVFLGGSVLSVSPLPMLGFAAASYVAGFLIFSEPKRTISITTTNSEVELKTIQTNIAKLRFDIARHANRIPDEIMVASENIFTTLEEIIPRWKEMDSFSDQKYTINSVITEYFPEIITSYMNLPKSYYRNGTKSKAAYEIREQLGILQTVLDGIRDNVYEGVEKNIKVQSQFLKDKFVQNEGNRLSL